MLSVHVQDLGPYPLPSQRCTTILSSVDGGQSNGGTAGGGHAPADPAAQEELFVDDTGTSAIWRTIGGQVTHSSFRSAVLGPGAHGLMGNNGHGSIAQVVRCRFPETLEGWSSRSEKDPEEKAQQKQHREQQQKHRRGQRDSSQCREGPWSVCILRPPDLVIVHYPNGDSYDVTLPCEARLLQPLREGLLVQRFSGDGEYENPLVGLESNSRRAPGGYTGLESGAPRFPEEEDIFNWHADDVVPSLFTLRHPLDELRPVALLPPSPSAVGVGVDGDGTHADRCLPFMEDNQRLVCDACERVVFTGGGGPDGTGRDSTLLLTYHSGRQRHSLWLVLPVPEPEDHPDSKPVRERRSMGPPPPRIDEFPFLGPVGTQTPMNDSWRAISTGLPSTPAADTSSLSSTLLGVSALDSSSSAAGLSMIDSVMAGGRTRRDRMSFGNSSRVGTSTFGGARGRASTGGGAGRRASSGSNTSWVGGASTRNEALASALGLGQSGLGVTSSVLGLGQQGGGGGIGGGGGGGGVRRAGSDAFAPPLLAGNVGGAVGGVGGMTFDEKTPSGEELGEDGTEPEEAQPIRPHLGISLVWREAQDSHAPAQHVFCAAAAMPGAIPPGERKFLVCMIEGQAEKLRALSISVSKCSASDNQAGSTDDLAAAVTVAEAFTTPCRSAVGVCATSGSGGGLATDILILTPERRLTLQRGGDRISQVGIPIPSVLAGGATDFVEDDEPESLSEAVESCFTLTMCTGTRRRLRLSLDPASSLVSACMGAWDCFLTPVLAASLRVDVMCVAQVLAEREDFAIVNKSHNKRRENDALESNNRGASVDGEGQARCRVVGTDVEWTALVSVLRQLIVGETRAHATAMSSQMTESSEPNEERGANSDARSGSLWAAMLASPFHEQYACDSAMLLSGLRESATETTSPAQVLKEPFTWKRQGLPDTSERPRLELQTQRATFLDEIGAVLDALHLTLEEMKTSRLTLLLVPRMASLLLSLTRLCGRAGESMRDFTDHYWRDAAACGDGSGEVASMVDPPVETPGKVGVTTMSLLPSRPTRFNKVPCLRGWVHARMRTGRLSVNKAADASAGRDKQKKARTAGLAATGSLAYVGDHGVFPTLPKGCRALQRTRQLCRFYGILCSENGGDSMGQNRGSGRFPTDGGFASQAQGYDSHSWVGARLIEAMVQERYSMDDLERVPLGLTLPFLEVLQASRGQAPADWPAAAHQLVGREDLSALRHMLEVNFGENRTGSKRKRSSGRDDYHGHGASGDGKDLEGEEKDLVCDVGEDQEDQVFGATGGFWGGGRISSSGAGGRDVSRGNVGGHTSGESAGSASGENSDLDGLAWVDELSSLRFGRDRRVREACRLLRGSRPIRFHVERSPESSDHDHQQKQQARLLQLAMRTLAGPVGRGMLTLGTLAPLLAEPLPIPPLCLAGRIRKPADVVVNLDVAAGGISADTTLWAEFHNGVAAGLRLQHEWGFGDPMSAGNRRHAGGRGGAGLDRGGVSRTWITYNRPSGGANNAHGGLLMALGLQGHLSSLAMTDVYEYLTLGQESTTVGVLLGMAAARRGSAELSTHKMLCLHVPSLLPHPFTEMETSSVTQAAALAGVGLLYQGTSHRLMTEFLLGEMGKSPYSDRFADREGYALACGLSLGMINLGKGASGEMAGVADLKLEQQLHRYMSGGKDPSAQSAGGTSMADPAAAGGRSGIPGRAAGTRPPGSGGVIGSESFGPSRISPGEYVNTDVTAPAALIALALVHMRSGDKALAERLELPQTHFQLDYVRPEQLLLRVVVRGLVMWDEVQPTEEWIDSQMPEVVSFEYARLHEPLPEELASVVDRQTIRQAHANIIAGACLCLGLRFAGTAEEHARAAVLSRVMHFKRLRECSTSAGVVGAGAGAAAMGTRNGGAGQARDPHLPSRKPERPVLEMCLSTAVTALGMIMAGTGNLDSLRVMRELRARVEGEVTYGTHMAISMSIGLLFLGGGMASLGREKEHIAALLAAFFPRYPASPDDNQYHLQALRHMYVLAVQRRGVDAIDVDTGERLFVPVTVSLLDKKANAASAGVNQDGDDEAKRAEALSSFVTPSKRTAMEHDADDNTNRARRGDMESGDKLGKQSGDVGAWVTPCILPDLSEISRISIRSPRYFPVELNLTRDPAVACALRRYCRIYVKRRVGHLSFKNDPHALRSLLFQSYPGPMSSSDTTHSDSQHSHHYSKGHGQGNGGDLTALGASGSPGSGGSSDPGQSKADFLSTFTEDPHLLNFARHFCDTGGQGSVQGSGNRANLGLPSGRRLMLGTEALGDAPALARYFGGALLECLAGEKEDALGPHLSLCHAAISARHTLDASAAWDLRLVAAYGRGSALQEALAYAASCIAANSTADDDVSSGQRYEGEGYEHGTGLVRVASTVSIRSDGTAVVDGDNEVEPPLPFALLHSDLLASLEVQLTAFLSSMGFDRTKGIIGNDEGAVRKQSPLWQYLSGSHRGGRLSSLTRDHRVFCAFLVFFGIPAPSALEEALGSRGLVAGELELTDIPSLVRSFPGISPSALLRMTSTGDG